MIAEIAESKLLGRGGAAFPTGRKWDAVARNPVHPHYVICNADESEPGTFKDRIVIENDPFSLIEALTIAGFATGTEQAYIYLRGELTRWPGSALATHAVSESAQARPARRRRAWARGSGSISKRSAWAPAPFRISRRGNRSVQLDRGLPRRAAQHQPPFPVDVGLFGKPTVVNNVESLINVLDIVLGRR